MKKTLIFTATACMAGLTILTYAEAPTALRGGMVPEADILIHVNNTALNQSAFNKAMKENLPAEKKSEQEAKEKKFSEATGLDAQRDILAMVISANIDSLNMESPDKNQLAQVPGVAAFQLGKAITLKQATQGILSMLPDTDGVTSEETELGGHPAVVFSNPEKKGDGPDKLFLQMDDQGKTALLAFSPDSVIAGRKRIVEQQRPTPSAELANAIAALGKSDMRCVVLLPAEVQAKLKAQVDKAAAEPGMGAMFAPLGNLKGIFLGVSSTENLDLNIQLDVGDNAVAQQLNGMVQGMLPMMMMGMSQQLGPKAMTLPQKFKIAAEGTALTIRASLSPEDLKPDPNAGSGGGLPPGLGM